MEMPTAQLEMVRLWKDPYSVKAQRMSHPAGFMDLESAAPAMGTFYTNPSILAWCPGPAALHP
jgi:hypothetical protein